MAQDYIWNLTDLKNVPKNGYKVFSCFACGGAVQWATNLQAMKFLGTVK